MKKILSLFLALSLFLFPAASHAALLTPHSYAVKYSYSAADGIYTVANNPVSDLQNSSNDYFVTKEIWAGFPGAGGQDGWVEVGGIEGANIATIGTWNGYFSGWNYCSGGSCSFSATKHGTSNPSDTSASYQIIKYSGSWATVKGSTVLSTSPYSSSTNATSGIWGVEVAGSTATYASGTEMTNTYRNNGGWYVICYPDSSLSGSYPPNHTANFTCLNNGSSNKTTFTHT